MKLLIYLIIVFYVSLLTLAFAKEASVKILSPSEGSKLSKGKAKIDFEAMPGPKGDHLHIYVDNGDPIIVRKLKGSETLDKLEAGNRNICVKLVDKNHTPVGVEQCIKVNVE